MATPVTRGGDDALRQYLLEISEHPLLTKCDERTLGERIRSGRTATARLSSERDVDDAEREALVTAVLDGDAARLELFVSNLRLGVAVARSYVRSGVALEDLIQEGNLGLLRAVDRLDHRKGFAFSTYARYWIRQAIQLFITTDSGLIRLSVRASEHARKVHASREHLTKALGRRPSIDEVADDIGASGRVVAEVDTYGTVTGSLDDHDDIPAALAADPEAVAVARSAREEVARALAQLPQRSRHVLHLRFGFAGGDGLPRTEIGRELGVSRVRVAQIEAQAIKILGSLLNGALRDLADARAS